MSIKDFFVNGECVRDNVSRINVKNEVNLRGMKFFDIFF